MDVPPVPDLDDECRLLSTVDRADDPGIAPAEAVPLLAGEFLAALGSSGLGEGLDPDGERPAILGGNGLKFCDRRRLDEDLTNDGRLRARCAPGSARRCSMAISGT